MRKELERQMETRQEKRFTLERLIDKSEERTYLEVPFEIGEGYERVEVRLSVTGSDDGGGPCVVDLGLRSPERIVGWSGGARDRVFVSAEKATPGYLPRPVAPGTWAVLLGAYRVPEAGCLAKLEVTLAPPVPRWLKGDLHTHSVHSDGTYTIAGALDSCRSLGLDFIALTDHNTASQNAAARVPDEKLLVIPGVELTSYMGHVNLLGQPDALDDFRVLNGADAADGLSKARERGAFVSLNHPFCPDCPWLLGFDVPFDAIEVWNGPWRGLNETAVRWWQEQLASGHRIIALGGSDTHRPNSVVRHGGPTAFVRSETDTVSGIMDGIRAGRVVLSYAPDGTFASMDSRGSGSGDIALPDEDGAVPLTIEVSGAAGDVLALWSDRGIEAQWRLEGPADREAEWAEAARKLAGFAGGRELRALADTQAAATAAPAGCRSAAEAAAEDISAANALAGGRNAAAGTEAYGPAAGETAAAESAADRTAAATSSAALMARPGTGFGCLPEPLLVQTGPGGSARLIFAGSADRLFYRLEARRFVPDTDVSVMTCLTNPIFIKNR
ncbi:CehA/McbA family metallohydrolase [Paenibacillus humicola]|uniref:CehA/McbA family metallohydrolase n=1 Tax=Paenibacillus humicola TaxID=3110540 RepID=UPI00237A0C98|nr:CehA/McbA family metallohydrolase [Paenibacillus humicola]